MKKTVLFVILDEYADWESSYLSSTIKQFGQEDWDVKTVSHTLEPVSSIGGFITLPDYSFSTIPKDFEAIFLIGGNSWKEEYAKQILPIIAEVKEQGKVIGAICAASEFLAVNGIVNDVAHTSNGMESIESCSDSLYDNSQGYVGKQAVCDKKVVTANGTATLEFAREGLKALNIAPDDDINGWYEFFKNGFYSE